MLEVSEVPHWAKTFQVLVKINIQQEAQPTQAPVPNFSVPPPNVNVELSHQQGEISRLTQVMQQWSAKGPHQYNQSLVTYNQKRFNTSTGRGRSIKSHSTPNLLLVPNNRTSRHFNEPDQKRHGYHDRRFQHNHHQKPDQRRYLYASQALSDHTNNDTASIVLNSLEKFSVKISVQPLGHAVLGSIQEFDGKDKSATISWLDQVKLVAEKKR